ncbi:MAG: hypothetical protein Q8N08_07755, partial [Methanobacteriaceae archaeon]|nr:hypothetical protein [Methanobacteriaceae archaeon]
LKVIEHGMDIRLLDREICERLKEMKWARGMKFAYDQVGDREAVQDGIALLKEAEINVRQYVQFYVLVGYNTTVDEDIGRCEDLKKWGTGAYVMMYEKTPILRALARWSNWKPFYRSMSFEEYKRENFKG